DPPGDVGGGKTPAPPGAGPPAIVLTRQKLPFLGTRTADVARGAYVLYPSGADAAETPDLILIATGSEVHVALGAAKPLADKGTQARVVSMPSWRLFDAQDEAYRRSVLPPEVKARLSIEAGATIGWAEAV